MRILVCGGRNFKDRDYIYSVLDSYKDHVTEMCQGYADGADRIALMWANVNKVTCRSYPADWETYGKSAGYIRNRNMLKLFKPDLVIAFPGGSGTEDMMMAARGADLEVRTYSIDSMRGMIKEC